MLCGGRCPFHHVSPCGCGGVPSLPPPMLARYAGAASGPKDVIIVLDKSGSMATKNRLTQAKLAAKWVINTLSYTDYATVVQFSSTAASATPMMLPMTVGNRAKLKNFVDNLGAFGATDFTAAFTKAFDTLSESRLARQTSKCNTVILFMTDGTHDPLKPFPEDPVEFVQKANLDSDTRIFTYNFGDDARDEKMKQIACASNGVYQQIPDGGDLKYAMASYFTYLAAGIVPATGESQAVRWAEMYEDGQGIGQNTAACAPVYVCLHVAVRGSSRSSYLCWGNGIVIGCTWVDSTSTMR